jgi:phage shock protein E
MKTVFTAVALAASGIAFAASMTTPAEVAEKIRQPQTAPYVLDVRTREEFADGHVPHAVNIPLQELGAGLDKVPKDRDIVVYCHSGARATRGAALLREKGYTRVSEMTGSLMAWEAAKLPLEK